MSLDLSSGLACHRKMAVEGLLETGLSRLRRQKQYARMLERGGNRAAGLQEWLTQASDCITALARPSITLQPVSATPIPNGVLIADKVSLHGEDLHRIVTAGGRFTAYLVTLGYSQEAAFRHLYSDYGAHHIQSDLSNEVLFALGREAHRIQREATSGARLKRIPVQVSDLCGARKTWDPQKVQCLLSVFDHHNPGVEVTDTGCFQPLSTLLGLTARL